jgi:hypothetical protein
MSNIEKLARYISTKQNSQAITKMFITIAKAGFNENGKEKAAPDGNRKAAQIKIS